MYKIVGADEKEYGPVSADQIKQWIAQGRANAQTRLQAEGTSEWRPLSLFPEFAEVLKGVAGAPPPTLPSGIPSAQTGIPRLSHLAVWSLVLGILGLLTCGVTAIPGLILGIIALVKLNRREDLGGQGLALAGTIVSAVFLLALPIGAGMLLPAWAKAKERSQQIKCITNIKQLELGVIMYASDSKDHFPPGVTWCDATVKYMGSRGPFKCVAGDQSQWSHYAFNSRLEGLRTTEVQSPSKTVMVFETAGGWNLTGGPELLLQTPRHGHVVVVGFADGHVETVIQARLRSLHWDP